MDLPMFNISQPDMTDEEIEKAIEKQKESDKATFFATNSGVGKRYRNKRLSDFIADTDEKKYILEQVKKYIEDVNNNLFRTLWLCGSTGTGKTLLGACICYETNGFYCKTYNIKDALLENHFSRNAVFKKYSDYRSLVIDEVGRVEQEKDFMFQLLNERYENEVSTVLITNLSKGELKERLGLPLYDRFVSNCVSLTFNGDSHRKQERKINI